MLKKRKVFLFGAGATLDWKSPKTSELTELVLKSGFKTIDNKTTITEFIYRRLLANGYSSNEINFETLINVIEELIVFYSPFNAEKKVPSILSCFFHPDCERELLNFSVEGGEIRHGFRLQIPAGKEYLMANYAYNNETPEQYYFQHLLNELLTGISTRIGEYAYHATGMSKLDPDSEISRLFTCWMKSMADEHIIRLYTLNYERIFKVLLWKAGIQLFEGFDCGEFIDYSARLRANVPRILSDSESHIHFNLHGSAFWDVLDLDKEQLPNPEIVLTATPQLPCNNSPSSFQVEKGKTLLVTNIVTGYQKAQKAMLTPFKQMQAAFDRDCCFADELLIIGYSFGDEHINESIKTAIRHNPGIRITIVDPFFIENNMDYSVGIKLFPFKNEGIGFMKPYKESENLYSYFSGMFTVHTLGFKDFLKRQLGKEQLV